MALRELKYNNTIIYVEDEVSEGEMGIALDKEEDKFGNTQEIKPIKLEKDFLEDTLTMEPIGVDYE
jgi:hypothetical protein